MSVKPHKIDAAADQDSSGSPARSVEASAVNDREDVPALAPAASGRALRHWLILANAAAWLLIILGLRLMFF